MSHDSNHSLTRLGSTCSPGELEAIVKEVKGQLRRLAITGNSRKDRVFLGIDVARSGFVSKENLRDMCIKQQLPCDNDIIDVVSLIFLL